MTPTIGRIVHVGYDLPNLTNATDLPCRAAIVTGDLSHKGMLPVTVLPPFQKPYDAAVDINTGWHDPRSCPRIQQVGANDGEKVAP